MASLDPMDAESVLATDVYNIDRVIDCYKQQCGTKISGYGWWWLEFDKDTTALYGIIAIQKPDRSD